MAVRAANKYKLKVGLAMLDIGKIKYDRDLQRSVPIALTSPEMNVFYLSELDSAGIDNYTDLIANRPQFFRVENGSHESSYKVALPSTL